MKKYYFQSLPAARPQDDPIIEPTSPKFDAEKLQASTTHTGLKFVLAYIHEIQCASLNDQHSQRYPHLVHRILNPPTTENLFANEDEHFSVDLFIAL